MGAAALARVFYFIYTQRRGPHNVCAGRRGPRADNLFFWFFSSLKLNQIQTIKHLINLDLLIWWIWIEPNHLFMQLSYQTKSTINGDLNLV